MIIGIDGRIPRNRKTGMGYLVENMAHAMVDFGKEEKYKILGGNLGIKKKNVRAYRFPEIIQRGFNFLWKYIHFPPANIFMGKVDIFFFPNFVDFPVRAKKKVLMIADMSFIKFPQFTERKNLSFLKKGVEDSIKRADRILTISQNAKKEICEHYNLKEEMVGVAYLGCPKSVSKISDLSEIDVTKRKYGISGDYILFVGTIEPRKNIIGLVSAYEKLSKEKREKYQLVICGGKGWYWKEIFDIVKERNLVERVVFTGYTQESDMSAIYSGASLFVSASLYEGFGIPVLEAFICGVPVVCSGTSSFPEVGGDAALYFDPSNVGDISDAISRALEDKGLRDSMVRLGYVQAKKFSWENSAKKIFDSINSFKL